MRLLDAKISTFSAGCKWEGCEISLGAENQRLVWCRAEELDGFDMPPADYPLLPAIKRFMAQYGQKCTS